MSEDYEINIDDEIEYEEQIFHESSANNSFGFDEYLDEIIESNNANTTESISYRNATSSTSLSKGPSSSLNDSSSSRMPNSSDSDFGVDKSLKSFSTSSYDIDSSLKGTSLQALASQLRSSKNIINSKTLMEAKNSSWSAKLGKVRLVTLQEDIDHVKGSASYLTSRPPEESDFMTCILGKPN
jgi:hypothetical protein